VIFYEPDDIGEIDDEFPVGEIAAEGEGRHHRPQDQGGEGDLGAERGNDAQRAENQENPDIVETHHAAGDEIAAEREKRRDDEIDERAVRPVHGAEGKVVAIGHLKAVPEHDGKRQEQPQEVEARADAAMLLHGRAQRRHRRRALTIPPFARPRRRRTAARA
jgi:hypothetical protein